MKIRKDFVTNSSSTSYILSHFDEEIFEKKRQEELKYCVDDFEKEDWMSFSANRFTDYDLWTLEEVFCWYSEKLLYDKLQIELPEKLWLYEEKAREVRKELFQALQKELSEENKKWMSAFVIWDFMNIPYYVEDDSEEKIFRLQKFQQELWTFMQGIFEVSILTEMKEFQGSVERFKEYLVDNLESILSYRGEYGIYDYIVSNYETILKYAKEFDGMHKGDILAYIFGEAQYLYYTIDETYYSIEAFLKEQGFCKFGCSHMG